MRCLGKVEQNPAISTRVCWYHDKPSTTVRTKFRVRPMLTSYIAIPCLLPVLILISILEPIMLVAPILVRVLNRLRPDLTMKESPI